MTVYYLYFFALWALAFLEFFTNKKNIYLFSLFIFFIFLALRLDTGYDWPVYKEVFNHIPELSSYSDAIKTSSEFGKEIGFVYFLSILKTITNDFQIIIIVVSIIESYAIYKFLILTSKSPSAVLAVVGTWLLFTLYFSVLRQGLAVSFFLLFFTYMHHQYYWRSFLMLLLSLSVQVSSLSYYFLYWLSAIKLKKKTILYIFLLSIIIAFFSKHVSYALFFILQNSGIPILAQKAAWYIQGIQAGANIFDIIFVYLYSISMFFFLYMTWDIYKSKLWIRISFFAVVFIFIQLIFIDYPLIRNRVQYVSFMMQFILLVNYFYNRQVYLKAIAFILLLITVFAYYYLMLNRTYGVVFIPYQDIISHKIFDYENTGDDRQEIMFSYIE